MIAIAWLGCGAAPVNPLGSIEQVARIGYDDTVSERIDARGYSYLHLDGHGWVVGLDKGHQPGDAVHVVPIGVAHDFTSGRTGHTFDTLTFGVLSRP
ncbi:MAG: hypothetical protein ABMB14_08485 [Myxococcota bacterium]